MMSYFPLGILSKSLSPKFEQVSSDGQQMSLAGVSSSGTINLVKVSLGMVRQMPANWRV